MGHFERDALAIVRNPPSMCFRYVDDTMTKFHEEYFEPFSSKHHRRTQFVSKQEEDGKIPFLNTCIHVTEHGST